MTKKIIITGGAGFIGGKLSELYIKKGYTVTAIDNLQRNRGAVEALKDSANFNMKNIDILDLKALDGAFDGADYVVHAAAIAGIDTVAKHPVNTMEINILGTSNVLKATLEQAPSVKKVITFSTSEIFGRSSFKTKEIDSPSPGTVGEARWVYAVSKLATEHLSHAYFHQYGLPTTTVRPFNVYGPGQLGEGAMHVMIRRALENKVINIFGDGTSIRGWCYVDDFINGMELVFGSDKSVGESYNIGDPRSVLTTLGLAQTICRVLKSKSKIEHLSELSADVELRVPNIDKAKRDLNFYPSHTLETGILKTAEFYKALGNKLPKLPSIFGD